jgi:hypothetical protein
MAFQTRILTHADVEKIEAFHRGEIQIPLWITSWKQKIEDETRNVAAAIAQEALTKEQQQRYMHAIVKMMRRKDYLYDVWMQDLPFKTWDDLARERPPTGENLFKYTVLDTEDFLNGPGVPAFAFFLNKSWPGFLRDFAHALLRECDPLLEEALTLTPDIRRLLSYPEQVFGTKDTQIIETRLLEWACTALPKYAPYYATRLVMANVMVALGNEIGACYEMEFARCEAAEPLFPQLIESGDSRANIFLEQSQRWQIDVMLKLWPTDEQNQTQ